jgi:beta-xylosidase
MLRAVPVHQRRSASAVHNGDFPDPFVLLEGGRYFAFGTQTGDINLQVMESADLVRWEHRGDALPDLPSWAGWGHTWAPSVLRRGETYVLYYAVRYEAAGRQAVSVATASDPAGPFVDKSAEPLIFQEERGGSIDASPFVDDDGAAYLLWKSDDNALERDASLWGAPLEPDGLALAGPPAELLRYDAPWEDPLVEAPSLARAGDGSYVLFYSGGWWEGETYAMGYALASEPLGPYRKETESGPWLAGEDDMVGPGGGEVFRDADGGWRIAFHAWTPPKVGYENGGARSLWIERFDFEGGRPV